MVSISNRSEPMFAIEICLLVVSFRNTFSKFTEVKLASIEGVPVTVNSIGTETLILFGSFVLKLRFALYKPPFNSLADKVSFSVSV